MTTSDRRYAVYPRRDQINWDLTPKARYQNDDRIPMPANNWATQPRKNWRLELYCGRFEIWVKEDGTRVLRQLYGRDMAIIYDPIWMYGEEHLHLDDPAWKTPTKCK